VISSNLFIISLIKTTLKGFVLTSRGGDEVTLSILGRNCNFEILAVNEFTSERRRMSIIARLPDDSIRLFIKGIRFFLKYSSPFEFTSLLMVMKI
jgi:magnesium-transporting ATPase (P-type)